MGPWALPLAVLDWNVILVALIAALPGTLAALGTYLNRKAMRMPSGGTIGQKVEETAHLSNTTHALTNDTNKRVRRIENGQATTTGGTGDAT